MALVVKDRVKQFSTTSGTGTITLGATPTGFQAFSVLGDGSTTYYAIVDNNNGDWEVGLGTYTASGTTLSRDTVLSSSNSGSLVNFSSDNKEVFVTYPAEKAVYEQANGAVELPGDITFTSAGKRITGDFTGVPLANRLMLQTTSANETTSVGAIPSGTGISASWDAFSSSDPNNASFGRTQIVGGVDFRVVSGLTGTGTYLPMTFYTGGSERVRLDTSGNFTLTGLFLGANGTAAAPAISASADTNTGVYFPAADTVGVATGGSERVRVTSTGRLGIGTTAPTQTLDVNGSVVITGSGRRITADFSNTSLANRTMFQTSLVNSNTNLSVLPNGTATTTRLEFYTSSTDPTNSSVLRIQSSALQASVQATITGTGTYLPLTFATGGVDRLQIEADGDVVNKGVFYYNARTITASITLSATDNAMSIGPITISDPAVVTVPDGGNWLIS